MIFWCYRPRTCSAKDYRGFPFLTEMINLPATAIAPYTGFPARETFSIFLHISLGRFILPTFETSSVKSKKAPRAEPFSLKTYIFITLTGFALPSPHA
jgi:hypothetical protein